MAQGKSLTPFYVVLGVIALAGGAFIVRSATSSRAPTLSLDLAPGVPLATGARGVTIGSDSAPVELTEFADFQCPSCARFAVLTLADVKSRLVADGRIRFRFIHYPLQQIHPNAPLAHLAAACANEQGRFWEYHDELYRQQDAWAFSRRPLSVLEGIATTTGLDRARFDSCISEQRAWPQVLADKRFGDSVGVGGTPTVLLNGRLLADVPSYDRVRAIVDSLAPVTTGTAPARR